MLRTRGKRKRRAHSASYTRYADDYEAGTRTFGFDAGIYGHATVKTALKQAQHDKCCFCESKISHISYGDVEHFRPKAGFRNRPGEPLTQPGYYWLAYEWANLYLACQLCNQRHKENLFPVADGSPRAQSHHEAGEVELEETLFLDPGGREDPSDHISFRAEVPYAVGGSEKGRTTIDALGLGRPELCERRAELLEMLRVIHEVANMPVAFSEAAKARRLLAKAQSDSCEYAGMVRAAVACGFAL